MKKNMDDEDGWFGEDDSRLKMTLKLEKADDNSSLSVCLSLLLLLLSPLSPCRMKWKVVKCFDGSMDSDESMDERMDSC